MLAFGVGWVGRAIPAGSGITGGLRDTLGAGEMIAILGLPVYAVALRYWYRWIDPAPDGVARVSWRHAFEGAALSLGYWFCCSAIMFGLFAGDPPAGERPLPAEQVYRWEVVVAVVMIGFYAAASWWWRGRTLRSTG